jgi:hypothetical protein
MKVNNQPLQLALDFSLEGKKKKKKKEHDHPEEMFKLVLLNNTTVGVIRLIKQF